MSVNDNNITAGAKEMCKALDNAKTRQDAEVVADRLRADYLDCMSQGAEGQERWGHIAQAMKWNDKKGKGYDVVIDDSKALPEITLVDGENSFLGFSISRVPVNKADMSRKGVTPEPYEGATDVRKKPIEMK